MKAASWGGRAFALCTCLCGAGAVLAQDFGCNARVDLPLNGFAARLSEETGAGGFATTLRFQMNGVDLYADALANLPPERRGAAAAPASPMARMIDAAPGLRSVTGFSPASAWRLADLLGGRQAVDYFAALDSDLDFVVSTLDNQLAAADRLFRTLGAIRNDMLAWQSAGLIDRTRRQLTACAAVCATPALATEAESFAARHGALSDLIRPAEFDRGLEGIVPHVQTYVARLRVLQALARQAQSNANAAAFLARDRAWRMATEPASTDEILGQVRAQETAWVDQQHALAVILRDEIINRESSGRARMRAGLERVAALLDSRNGLRQALLAYQRACGG